MVAIVSGNGTGLNNTSASVLGQNGLFGSASTGSSREGAYVNVANGNLTLQDKDDYIAASGVDLALTRTYNSQGAAADGFGAQWKLGVRKQVTNLTGTINTAGSTLTRIDGDGTAQLYKYDTTRAAYVSTDGAGSYQSIVLDENSKWVWRSDRSDMLGLREVYDPTTGVITSVKDEVGTRLTYTYNVNGQLSQITDATGDVTYFDFVNGNISQIRTVAAGSAANFVRTSYAYDTQGRLSSATVDLTPTVTTDAVTYTTTYTYDGTSNRIASLTQSDGTSLTFTYTSTTGGYKVASVTDGLGRKTSYDYSVAGKTSVTDPLGNVTAYSYDANGQLTQVTQAQVNGVSATTTFTYDAQGNVTSIVDPNGRTDAWYDAYGNQVQVRDSSGRVTVRTFDTTSGKVLTEQGVDNTHYVYDTMHRTRFIVSGDGRVTEYRYNANGDRSAAIAYPTSLYPVGSLPANSALTEAQMTSWVASSPPTNAATTLYTYDARGLLTKTSTYATADSTGAPTGTSADTTYIYDQAGQLLTQTDPDGQVTRYTYDGLGRVLTVTDGAGNTTTNVYDDAHNTLRTTLATGLVTTSVFDKAGQLLTTTSTPVEGSAPGTTRYVYDADGRRCMVVDPAGIRTFALYDQLGRRVATIDGDGSLTEFVYDTANNLARTIRYATRIDTSTLVDASGTYLFKALSAIRPAAVPASDRSTWNIYDNLGRITDAADGEGYVTHYDYDLLGRLVQVTQRATPIDVSALPNINTSFAQAPSADDRVTRSIYDNDDHLLGTLDAEGYLTEYRYDAAGRKLEAIQYQTPKQVAPGTTLTIAAARPATSATDVHQRFIYDSRGRLVGTVDGKGYLTENAYTLAGNLAAQIMYGTPVSTTFTDDTTIAALRPVATSPDDRSVGYLYDGMNRLVRKSVSNGVVTNYAYDKLGNLTSQTVAQGLDTQSGSQYRLDSQGNLAAELSPIGVAALASTDSATVWAQYATTYTYDADGRRASMTDPNGNRTLYYYDNDGRVAYTVNALGEVRQTSYNAFGQVAQTTQYAKRIAAATVSAMTGGAASKDIGVINALASSGDSIQTYAYDRDGNLTDQVDALAFHTIRKYDGFGEVTGTFQPGAANSTTIDPAVDGFSRVFYDRDGRVSATVTGAGSLTVYQYDGSDHVTDKITYAKPVSVANLATATKSDVMAGIVADPAHDAHQRFIYDASAQLVGILNAAGANTWTVTRQTFDVTGNLIWSRTYVNTLTSSNPTLTDLGAVVATDNDQLVRSFYDSADRLWATATALRKDPDGWAWSVTKREYDTAGNVTAQTSFATPLKTNGWPTASDLTVVASNSAADQVTRYAYDRANQLSAAATAQGVEGGVLKWAVTSYAYDKAGNLISRTQVGTKLASSGASSTFTQSDWRNWILGGTAPSASDRTTRYAYDALNRVKTTIDAAGAVTGRVYDAKGNVVKTIAYATADTSTGPIPAGYVPQASNADRVTRAVYDADNRLVFNIDALGDVTEYRYDARGNVVKTIAYAQPLDLSKIPDLPAIADVKPAVTSGDRTERRVYDQAGRLRYVVDAAGYVKETRYDGAGRATASIAWDVAPAVADGASVATWTTALAGNVNRAQQFSYDAQGNLLTATDAAGGAESYQYDGVGRKIRFTNKLGNVWDYQYDAAGNLRVEQAPPVSVSSVGVTNNGDGSASWGLSVASAVRLETHMDYDAFGRLTARTEAYGITGQQRTTAYAYDAAGHQVTITYPNVSVYDGATDNVMANGGSNTVAIEKLVTPTVVVGFDAFGNAVVDKDVGGNYSYKVYDKTGQVKYAVDAMGYITQYDRDAFGNVTKLTRYAQQKSLAGQGATPLTMSDVDTFVSANKSAADRVIQTQYDLAGRVTKVIEPQADTYDNKVDASGNATGYGYVSAAKTTRTLYNAFGDALRVSVYGADASGNQVTVSADTYYLYSLLGQQVSQIDIKTHGVGGGAATGYLSAKTYDPAGNLKTVTEYAKEVAVNESAYSAATGVPAPAPLAADADNPDRTTTYQYDTLNRKTAEIRPNAVTTYYGYDAVGNQVFTTDAQGNTTYSYFDALGRVKAVATVPSQKQRTQLAQMYLALLGRAPDAAGFASNLSLLKQGTDLLTIAQALYNANPAFASASDSDFVNSVYNGLMGRNAEPGGVSVWTSAITGMVRSGYSLAYARAQTALNIANAVVSGIQTDTVAMNDKVASALAFVDSGSNDVSAATANAASAGANANARIRVAQVYLAVLGRAATSDQLNNWAGQLAAGTTSLDAVAQQVYASTDGQALYNMYPYSAGDIEIAARIYQNVYGRAPSSADLEYWAGMYRNVASQRIMPPTGAFGIVVANLLNTLTATGNIGSVDWTQFQSRVAATLPEGVDTYASPAALSEFTRDAYGNVIQKVDRVAGAQFANATSYGASAGNDRITTTRYDINGNAIEVIDGNNKASFASYDVYGHVAKQWQTVLDVDGNARTAFKVFSYDATGQLTDVFEPGSLSAIGQRTQTFSSQYVRTDTYYSGGGQYSLDTFNVTTTTTISYNGTVLSTTQTTSQGQVQHGQPFPSGTTVQDVPVTLPPQLAGLVRHHTDFNGFGETLTEWVSNIVNGAGQATTTTLAQSFDAAGHVWRSNAGDGITKVMLYDIEGHETVDIRNVSGQALEGISSASLANSAAGMMRTETHFDLLGNAVQQILPTHSGVSITDWSAPPPPPSASAGMEYLGVSAGTPTYTRQLLYYIPQTGQSVYGNSCSQQISWPSLANLGSGDVCMEVTYSGGYGGSSSFSKTLASGSADTGMTFTAMAPDGGSITITSIKVSKRDIKGNLQLLMQTSGTSGSTKLALFPASSDPSLVPVLKVRPAGSTAAWTSVSVMNFSDKVALNVYQQLGSMLSGDVDFRLFYVQPGVDPTPDVTPANLAGTMVLPGSNSVQINVQSGSSLPAAPAGSDSTQAVTPVVNRTYDRWGNARTVSDARNSGWLTKYTYNANNQVTQTQDALGNIVKYAYDKMGRRLSVTDARGAVNQMRYDAAGNLVEELHADGGVVQYGYDALGQKTFERNASGVITRYGYDRVGNLVRKDVATDIGVNLATTSLQSTGTGTHAQVTGTVRGGMSDTYTYDALGHRIKQQNAAGEVTRTYYDLRGNVIQTIDNSGATTAYVFDHLNRKTAQVDADYKKQAWTYSGLYLQTHTDLGGAVVNYTYNNVGQVATQYTTNRSGSNQKLAYTYDASSGLLLRIDDTGDGKDAQVTQYAYDAAGNRIREKTSVVGLTNGVPTQTKAVAQDNLIAFDALNRITDVNDRYFIQHTDYDANGNRTHVKTTTVGTSYVAETWNAFDNMNRETVIDGAWDGSKAIISNAGGKAVGQAVYYDNSGNRIFAMQYGTALSSAYNVSNGTRAWSQGAGYATETYGYDAAGRVTDVWRNGAEVSQRSYDAASRLVSSKFGTVNGSNASLLSSLSAMKLNTDSKVYVFDTAGRVKQESDSAVDGTWKIDVAYNNDVFGTLQYYNVTQNVSGSAVTASYSYSYTYYDERKVKTITAYQQSQGSTTFIPGTTTNTYDGNGYLVKVDSTTYGKSSTLTNDIGGLALVRNTSTRSLIVNGQVMGSLDISGGSQGTNIDTFKASYSSLEDGAMGSSSVGVYTAQSGDTLQSIAKAYWGDANLWYLIADANGLTSVTAGQQLIIPARVGAATNNYQNVKSYDPAKIIGDTTPEIAGAITAAPANDNGCGTLGMILVIVVAVVVTVYTAGAAASAIAEAAGSTAFSGMSTMAAGAAALGGAGGAAGFAGAVVGGAVGSIASQGTAMAMGMQDHFSWLNVAYSALGSGVTAGLGQAASAAQEGNMLAALKGGPGAFAARAAVANAMTQGVRIVNGKQDHFQWRQTAASAAGAWMGNEVTTQLGDFGGGGFAGQLTRGTLSGLAAGTVTGLLGGNAFNARQVATDAFGNALGNSLADTSSSSMGDRMRAEMDQRHQAFVDSLDASVQADLSQPLSVDTGDFGSSAPLQSYSKEELKKIGINLPTGTRFFMQPEGMDVQAAATDSGRTDGEGMAVVEVRAKRPTANTPLVELYDLNSENDIAAYLRAIGNRAAAGRPLTSQDISSSKAMLFGYYGYAMGTDRGNEAQLAGNMNDQMSSRLTEALNDFNSLSESLRGERYNFYSQIQPVYSGDTVTRARTVTINRGNRDVTLNWTADFSTWASHVGVSADEALRKTDFEVYRGVLDAAFDTPGVNSVSINGAWRPAYADYSAIYNSIAHDPHADQNRIHAMAAVVHQYQNHPWSMQHVTNWAVDINRVNAVNVNNSAYSAEPVLVRNFTNNLVSGNDGGIVWGPWRMWNNTNLGSYNNTGANTDQTRHANHIHYGLR